MLKEMVDLAVHRSHAVQLVQGLNRNSVRILMYHRFLPQHGQNFDRQCGFLATHYEVVSLADATRRLRHRDPVSNLAVITVDDGYADMHEVAFPILQKHGLPATLFVTTGFVNRTCWMAGDRVRYHFAHTREEFVEVTDDQDKVHRFGTRDRTACDRLRALLKRVPNGTRARILSELDAPEEPQETASLPEVYRPCTWEQLRAMAAQGISVGAHTVTHPILSRVETKEETEREVLESKACIERELQRKVETFAYPNGMQEDMSPASMECVRAHFQGAVTAISGLNAPGADVHQLLRLPCDPELPLPHLERLLAGPLRRSGATLS